MSSFVQAHNPAQSANAEIIYLFFIIFIIYKFNIIIFIKDSINKKDNTIINLDEFTTKFYLDYLDTIIKYKTVYYVDNAFGEQFSITNKVSADIDNERISEAHEEIIIDIINKLSPKAKQYLDIVYGEEWLIDYIRIQTLSLLLNYTNLTIEKLTIENFK